MKPLSALAVTACLGLFSTSLAMRHDHLADLVVRSISSSHSCDMTAVEVEYSQGKEIRITRLSRSSTGARWRRSADLDNQHVTEYWDDGDSSCFYDVAANTVTKGPSLHRSVEESGARARLLRRNYVFRHGGKSTVAGRKVIVVKAVPRHAELEQRILYLDRETDSLLRLEVVRADGKRDRMLETVSVKFYPPGKLAMPAIAYPSDAKMVDIPKSEPLDTASDLEPQLGFRPIIPETLPLGFEILGTRTSRNAGCCVVGISVSDGLIWGWIHEWKDMGSDSDWKPTSEESTASCRGLRVLVGLRAPIPVREALLTAFTSARR